jgi:hypothetical protein
MLPDVDIWRAALAMVKRYGDEAQLEAATLADQLLEKDGDPVASATWQRIILDATARAPWAHSFGDQARQSLTVEVPDGGFLLARFPQFLAISFDRAAPELDIPSRGSARRRHHSPARANNLCHVRFPPPTPAGIRRGRPER